jgi:tetratricopeptide (TPR) repeat protein
VLALAVIAAYLPTFQNGFVNLDDPQYVTANAYVKNGLTWDGFRYAFTSFDRGFWHPLTWLSLMLDRTLYSAGAWGFHTTSLAFHIANTILLFIVFRRMTGAIWRSAMVAALFGLHPLHVESVAWISERKDVLSGFFFMLTLLAYAKYVSSGESRVARGDPDSNPDPNLNPSHPPLSTLRHSHAFRFYALSLLCFTLGLMSKTMLVTLPVLLLLLDYWPLRRLRVGELRVGGSKTPSVRALLVEKIPFFGLALVSGLLTLRSQGAAGAIQEIARIPMHYRVENALLAYVRYLVQTVWPLRLAGYYAFPPGFSSTAVAIAGVLLTLISVFCLLACRRRPYITVGWIWYGVTLLPVIGLIYVGSQSQADRYTYLPLIGVFTLVVWGVSEMAERGPQSAATSNRIQAPILAIVSAMVLILCAAVTWRQVGYWKDGITLFSRALQVTTYNPLAHNNLGTALFDRGHLDDAILQYQEALRQSPNYPSARQNLGAALLRRGRTDEAIPQLQEAVRLNPTFAGAHCNLGAALGMKGRVDEAIQQFQIALQLKPDYREAQNNLRFALSQKAAGEKKAETGKQKPDKPK